MLFISLGAIFYKNGFLYLAYITFLFILLLQGSLAVSQSNEKGPKLILDSLPKEGLIAIVSVIILGAIFLLCIYYALSRS